MVSLESYHNGWLSVDFSLGKPQGSVPTQSVTVDAQQIDIGLAAYDALRVGLPTWSLVFAPIPADLAFYFRFWMTFAVLLKGTSWSFSKSKVSRQYSFWSSLKAS